MEEVILEVSRNMCRSKWIQNAFRADDHFVLAMYDNSSNEVQMSLRVFHCRNFSSKSSEKVV